MPRNLELRLPDPQLGAARSLKVFVLSVRAVAVGCGRQGALWLLHLRAARGDSPRSAGVTSWLQTRLTSVDKGRRGWSLVGDGLSVAVLGIEVAASVAAPDPWFVERAQLTQECQSTGRVPSRSPPRDLPPTSLALWGVSRTRDEPWMLARRPTHNERVMVRCYRSRAADVAIRRVLLLAVVPMGCRMAATPLLCRRVEPFRSDEAGRARPNGRPSFAGAGTPARGWATCWCGWESSAFVATEVGLGESSETRLTWGKAPSLTNR